MLIKDPNNLINKYIYTHTHTHFFFSTSIAKLLQYEVAHKNPIFLTLTGTRSGELMGRKSVDWKRPSCSSTVLHLGAKWVKGSLGSRAQYLLNETTSSRSIAQQLMTSPRGLKEHLTAAVFEHLLMCPMAVLMVTLGPPSSVLST